MKTELRSVDDKELANYAKNRGKSLLIRGNSMCEDQAVGKDLAVWLDLGKLVSRCDMVMNREGEARICRAQEFGFISKCVRDPLVGVKQGIDMI